MTLRYAVCRSAEFNVKLGGRYTEGVEQVQMQAVVGMMPSERMQVVVDFSIAHDDTIYGNWTTNVEDLLTAWRIAKLSEHLAHWGTHHAWFGHTGDILKSAFLCNSHAMNIISPNFCLSRSDWQRLRNQVADSWPDDIVLSRLWQASSRMNYPQREALQKQIVQAAEADEFRFAPTLLREITTWKRPS